MAETPMVPIRTEFPDLSGVPNDVLPPAKPEQTNYHVEKPVEQKEKKRGYFAVAISDLGRYIFEDILIPSSKDLFSGLVKKAVDVWIYGEPQKTSVRKESDQTYVSYNRYYNDRRDTGRDYGSSGRYSRDCSDDPNFLKFWSREEAEECLENLRSVIRRDGQVSVAFVYETCGQKCEHTSVNYGWYSLSDAAVIPYRDGYRIDFPKVKCISR